MFELFGVDNISSSFQVPESIVEDNTEDVEIPSDLRDKSPEEPNNDNNIDYIQQVEVSQTEQALLLHSSVIPFLSGSSQS